MPIKFKNLSGSATTYFWNFGDGSTSNVQNPSHFYTNNGIYNVTLIASSPNGADTLVKSRAVYIFSDVAKLSTCTAEVAAPLGTTGIYKVKFADLENSSSGPLAEQGYMDFTCYRAFVGAGNYYPMEITTFVTSEVFTRVYIDWNDDAAFDATELVMKTDKVVQNHYDTVFIPKTAVKDVPLRMRVISARASINTPDVLCSRVRNGQIEDYSVVVSSSIGVDKMSTFNYAIYPNPSKGKFNISGLQSKTTIRVLDVSGKILLTKMMNADGSIDLSEFSKGIYLLELRNNESSEVQKIVIE